MGPEEMLGGALRQKERTLICYAGSASKTSIDSVPLGIEFGLYIDLVVRHGRSISLFRSKVIAQA